MKKFLFVIGLVVIIGGGWWGFKQLAPWLGGGGGAVDVSAPAQAVIDGKGGSVAVTSKGNTADLAIPKGALAGAKNISLTALESSAWPAGARGAVYKLEPDGTVFTKSATLTVKLAKDPGEKFSLGYWLADLKRWEYIPTVRRADKTYQARIKHFSNVGGYQAGTSGTNGPALPPSMTGDAQTMEQAQATGNEPAAKVAEQRLRDTLSKLADSAISRFCEEPTPDTLDQFMSLWALAQYFGFDDLDAKFNQAVEQCFPPYLIEQTNNVPYSINLAGLVNSQGTATYAYRGLPGKAPNSEDYLWQAPWNVIQDATTKSTTTVQFDLPGFSSTPLAAQGATTDRIRLIFSLVGVKPGGKFPITITRIGTYTQKNYVPPQTILFKSDDKTIASAEASDSSSDSIGAGKKIVMEGILLEDRGQAGALVGFGKFPFSFPGQPESPPLLIYEQPYF